MKEKKKRVGKQERSRSEIRIGQPPATQPHSHTVTQSHSDTSKRKEKKKEKGKSPEAKDRWNNLRKAGKLARNKPI